MKKLILFTWFVKLLFLVPTGIYSQCDNLNYWDFPACPFSDTSVAVLKKVGGTYQCLGEGIPSSNVVFDINLSEVEKVTLWNICRNSIIINKGKPAEIGTICSTTFECQNDLHYYTPPTDPNIYLNQVIGISLPHMFGSHPTVYVGLRISECGLVIPQITSPPNNAENTGTSVLLDWNNVPSATTYTVKIRGNLPGSNIETYSGISTTDLLVNLDPNASYIWSVQANTATCDSGWETSHFWTGPANFNRSVVKVENINLPPTQVNIYTFFDEGRYETALDINAYFQINNLGKYVLSSESSIALMPGFEVHTGADFTAIVE